MENQLMDLKKSMDNTILKNGNITSAEKHKILRAALDHKERYNRYFFAPVFSFLLVASFFMMIGLYFYNESIVSNQISWKNIKNTETDITNTSSDNSKTDANDKKSIVKDKKDALSSITTTSSKQGYIVLNGYYYKKTNVEVPSEHLGEKVGEVKRIGDWSIKKSGDSNEISPGPIYAINGKPKDVFIAGKGVVYKDGINKAGFLEFERAEPIETVDTSTILSSKGDEQEVQIAYENVKNKVGTLYSFRENDSITSLFAISYEAGPIIGQNYNVPQGNTKSEHQEISGELFVIQYKKGLKIENSRFILPKNYETKDDMKAYETQQKKIDNWKSPDLIESFHINGLTWGVYKDSFHNDLVLKSTTNNFVIEITMQGDFSLEHLKDLMKNFQE